MLSSAHLFRLLESEQKVTMLSDVEWSPVSGQADHAESHVQAGLPEADQSARVWSVRGCFRRVLLGWRVTYLTVACTYLTVACTYLTVACTYLTVTCTYLAVACTSLTVACTYLTLLSCIVC
jgi:hypothetical protein